MRFTEINLFAVYMIGSRRSFSQSRRDEFAIFDIDTFCWVALSRSQASVER
ncbi:MAG TPA: hypothetical protein VHT52_05675 [Stellaceae bacterium]|nr:hypothetical protein [Stellaceae bacterium]